MQIHKKTVVIIIILFLAVTLAAVYLLATSEIGENVIRRQAESRIGAALGTPVSIGSLETNLLSRLLVEDIRVYTDSTAAEPSIRLARGLVRYRLWDLVRARLTLSDIVLDSLTVDAVRDSSGIGGIPVPAGNGGEGGEGGGFPLTISLGSAAVHDSEVRYRDRIISLDGAMRDIDVTVAGDDEGGFDLDIGAGPGNVLFRGRPLTIERLAVDGVWRDGVLDLSEVELDVTGLTVAGGISLDTAVSPLALEGNVALSGDPAPLADILAEYIPGRVLPLAGNIRLDASFSDLLDSARTASAELEVDSLRTLDIVLRDAAIGGNFRNSTLTIDEVRGALFGGDFKGTGMIDFSGELRHEAMVTLSGMELHDLLKAATGSEYPYTGSIGGALSSRGPIDYTRLAASAELNVDNLSRSGHAIEPVAAEITSDNGHFTAGISQGETMITAEAAISERELSGELDASINSLRPIVLLFGLTELDATGTIHGTLSGTLDRPAFEVTVDAGDAFFGGLPVASLTGRLSYRDGEFTVEESEFRGEAASVDSLVSAWGLPPAIHGGIEYSGTFRGWGVEPHLELTADLNAPAWNDIVFDRGTVDLSLIGRTLTIDRATFVSEGQPVSASAKYNIDHSYIALRLSLDDSPPSIPDLRPGDIALITMMLDDASIPGRGVINIDFSFRESPAVFASGRNIAVSDLYGMYSPDDSLTAGGELSFLGTFEGSMKQPSGFLDLSIDDPHYGKISADSLTIAAHIDSGGVTLESLAVRIEDFITTARGSVGFVRDDGGDYTIGNDSGISGSLRGRALQLALLNPFLPAGFTVEGDTAYDISWDGSVGAPQLSGEIRMDDTRVFRGGDTPVVDSLTVQLGFRDSMLYVDRFTGKMQDTPFSLAGTVSLAGTQQFETDLALSIAGEEALAGGGTIDGADFDLAFRSEAFDLALVRSFLPSPGGLSGRLQSDVTIGGTVADPVVNGLVMVDSLGYSPPGIDERLSDGALDIRFDGGTVTIDSLSVALGGGAISASGSMEYGGDAVSGLDLAGRIRGVTLDREDVFSVNVDTADLRFRRENSGYLLSGEAALGESRLEYNVSPQFIISYIRGERGRPQEPPALLRHTRMDIRLRGGDQLRVENNLANVRMHPELEFVGTLAEPNVTGRLTIEEGYILYLDRRFEVTQGVVDFVSRDSLQPIIEFQALANIQGHQTFGGDAYAVTFEISGPIDEAEIRLSSEPQLSRPDIVSLLTFGATGEQLAGHGEDNATVRNILADRIAKLGGEQLSMYVSRQLGDLLGIDRVSIQGDLFAVGGEWGPRLEASEQINERLEVTYTTNVGQLNQQGIRLDYKLSKWFSVEGHTNQAGKSGIDLKYNLKFR